jgi:hypothetical protein
MDEPGKELIGLLNYLLPGFLAYWIFYGLTSFQKPSQFERIVGALIFTLLIQPMIVLLSHLYGPVGLFFQSYPVVSATLGAAVVGLLSSWLANSDAGHRVLRHLSITSQTSYPSEWFGTFHRNRSNIILHSKDGSRLYGFPLEWPSDPTKGHFVLTYPSWQSDSGEVRLESVEKILVPVEEIRWVEVIYRNPPE